MQITYELVLPENSTGNGSTMVDGAETRLTLCQLQPLAKYVISVSTITTASTGGPQVLGGAQTLRAWTMSSERPSRPVVGSVSVASVEISVAPVENLVDGLLVVGAVYTLMFSTSASLDPPLVRRGWRRVDVGAGWYIALQLTSAQLNRSMSLQLGDQLTVDLVPDTEYSVSLVALLYMLDDDLTFTYSWPPVNFTTLPLTTSTQTTSTDPGTSDHHSTSTHYDSSTIVGEAEDSDATSAAEVHTDVSSIADFLASKTTAELSTSSSSSDSSSISNTRSFVSSGATPANARAEITTEYLLSWSSQSSSSFASSSAPTTAARVQDEVKSASQSTTLTSSDRAAVLSTHRDPSPAFGLPTASAAVEPVTSSPVTSSTASATTETDGPTSLQTVTTQSLTTLRLTTESDVVTTTLRILGMNTHCYIVDVKAQN